jgi:hypothetical protein
MAKKDDNDRSGMVQVELDEADWKQRAEKLASEEADRIKLKAKKKTHVKKWNEELIQLDASIVQLTEEVDTRKAWVPAQEDMFGANDTGGEDEAAAEEAPRGRRRRRGARAEAAGAEVA